jgi:hypothetical protein
MKLGIGVLLLAGAATVWAQQPAATNDRIGVYDSRSVAIAWAGSPSFKEWDRSFRAEYEKAKTEGDQAKIAELEKDAETRQRRMHMQGFSTAPVDSILDGIKESLPAIQKETGVIALVSKWDKEALARYPAAERVDVTMKLVDALQPDERQRKFAVEAQQSEPISLEEAENIKDW